MKKILVCAVVSLLLSCFGKITESRYYQLDYVPTPKEMLNGTAYPFTVRVRDFDIAEVYKRNNIVYRQSPYQLHFYNYEMWAVKPEYMIADILFRHLDASKIFSDVRRSIDATEPDFTVHGTVRALEEYDNQDEWYAHIAMNMNLQDNKTKKVLWSREWSYRKKVSNFEPIYVVRGLSELLELINNEAVADIDSVMASIAGNPRQVVVPEEIPVAPIEIEELPPPGEI
ncbi:MAG: PqiC family protein [Fibromonadales bacterium]|nr:PqiC family protein [Fibromonadales bacterium]